MDDTANTKRRVGWWLVVGGLFLVLVGSMGVIAYFGVGPWLAQPVTPESSSMTDASTVLGLHQASSSAQNVAPQPTVDPAVMTELLSRVGQHISLPAETPQVEVVTDPSTLPKQTFFSQAETDDVILVFNQARQAILYRPKTDTVIVSGTF